MDAGKATDGGRFTQTGGRPAGNSDAFVSPRLNRVNSECRGGLGKLGLTWTGLNSLVLSFSEQESLCKNFAMALKIRLTRVGAVHQPHYRVVVAEARSRRDGDPVEVIGTYDPRTKGKQVNLKLDRVDYWL